MGCAVCRWVKPGMMVAAYCSARSISAACRSRSIGSSRSIVSRTHSLTSSAIWSLRERAVCSRPPAGPISAVSRASTLKWISSSLVENLKRPDSISSRTSSRPRLMARPSFAVRIPCATSMSLWASEPAMSCA